ncbi:hypothetical protein TM1040_1649 [Ruegeria sp. TM1040]|uniref:hypothetical protein n=1 Tax=Ruegeria sp. (strain TM1040) TaxID=292414 RepID=UPI000046237A|nr:hypothetical protein [Ruegeria sp. TM1040]ABF64382.1 hypothetical protein TM1040_1649 [Ruegeria sp. TM1040]
MTGLIAFLMRMGFGGMVDKAISHLERRAELQNDREKLRSQTTVELAREAVKEAQVMADYNRAKLAFPWFWLFAALFLVPLAAWWNAVILDSIFGFTWSVADLPTPQMQEWAGDMIRWLFYVGTGVGALKSLR